MPGSYEQTGSEAAQPATIPFVNAFGTGRAGPGLAKTRPAPLVEERRPFLARSTDARWRDLFDRADLVTEGAAREEPQGRFWYGSTSMILPAEGSEVALLAAVAARDLHVRLRALRAARREACLRAPGQLGRLACEIRVNPHARGVSIDVDVQAPLIERRAIPRPAR
jgi:hypothetical protein